MKEAFHSRQRKTYAMSLRTTETYKSHCISGVSFTTFLFAAEDVRALLFINIFRSSVQAWFDSNVAGNDTDRFS